MNIIPHLWFDKEAKEAAEFYTSVFPDSKVTSLTTLHGTPSGDCDVVSFELWKQSFMAISAGPYFKFNPSVSFLVNFAPSREKNARELQDQIWAKLSDGGTVLMPLDRYPFSERFGWVQDRYGLSWQLILTDPAGEERPPIVPALMFINENYGKAEEAAQFYLSVFKDSRLGAIHRYGPDQEPNREGTVMFSDFRLGTQWFAAMENAYPHEFAFNEAISFMVNCDTQQEIDYYWDRLSAVPEAEQCGWLKDKYGLSWQVSPTVLGEMMSSGDPAAIGRVTQAFLKMKKFDVEALKRAFRP